MYQPGTLRKVCRYVRCTVHVHVCVDFFLLCEPRTFVVETWGNTNKAEGRFVFCVLSKWAHFSSSSTTWKSCYFSRWWSFVRRSCYSWTWSTYIKNSSLNWEASFNWKTKWYVKYFVFIPLFVLDWCFIGLCEDMSMLSAILKFHRWPSDCTWREYLDLYFKCTSQ